MRTAASPLAPLDVTPPLWWLWVRAALFLVTLATSGLFLLPVLQGRPVYDVQNG